MRTREEREEMDELRRLTRQRCLEAVRAGIPRASFLQVIIRFLSETRTLEDQPETPDEVAARFRDKLPFKADASTGDKPLPFPPQQPQATSAPHQDTSGAAGGVTGAASGEAHEEPLPRIQTQFRRPLGSVYDL